MPRNGDGSGDNGPINDHEILHGTSGDKTLQHTKHVAPMPKHEDGEALPGMNASGGAAAPLNDASEEYGASAPRNEKHQDDQTSTSTGGNSSSQSSRTGASSSSTTSKSQQQSDNDTKSSHKSHYDSEKHDLDSVSREKAERYVNLDEEDVQHAGSADKSSSGAQRSSQRAPKEVGPKEDVEQLHGKAPSPGDKKGNEQSSGRSEQHHDKKGGNDSHAKKSEDGGAHEGELDSMRHNAEKFVNLEE